MSHAPTNLAHQFDDLEQQKEASTLGMWAFLATEVMFFGGAFTAFTVYRVRYPEAFAAASHEMQFALGAINTGVLLCSSFTVALSVYFAHLGQSKRVALMLLATILLAVTFLCIKGSEYYLEYQDGLVPGARFGHRPHPDPKHPEVRTFEVDDKPVDSRNVQIFFCFYFAMTGIHATHMLIGIGIFLWVAHHAWRGRYSAEYYNPVEISGLYWHFVDLVWMFVFPMIYLLSIDFR
jgi:cytochrome c oxidase subunit 3